MQQLQRNFEVKKGAGIIGQWFPSLMLASVIVLVQACSSGSSSDPDPLDSETLSDLPETEGAADTELVALEDGVVNLSLIHI